MTLLGPFPRATLSQDAASSPIVGRAPVSASATWLAAVADINAAYVGGPQMLAPMHSSAWTGADEIAIAAGASADIPLVTATPAGRYTRVVEVYLRSSDTKYSAAGTITVGGSIVPFGVWYGDTVVRIIAQITTTTSTAPATPTCKIDLASSLTGVTVLGWTCWDAPRPTLESEVATPDGVYAGIPIQLASGATLVQTRAQASWYGRGQLLAWGRPVGSEATFTVNANLFPLDVPIIASRRWRGNSSVAIEGRVGAYVSAGTGTVSFTMSSGGTATVTVTATSLTSHAVTGLTVPTESQTLDLPGGSWPDLNVQCSCAGGTLHLVYLGLWDRIASTT